jgi:hypothetical protein
MGTKLKCPCEYCTSRVEDCRDTCEVYWIWYDQMIEEQYQRKRKSDTGD